MSAFEHSRFRIFNPTQHPLVHDITAFAYNNPRLPNVSLLSDAIDYIVASIYPNYQGTVANQAALPLVGNPNDYYIVSDDGDGRVAGYVWSVIDNTGQWVKRYDVDWSFDAVMAETISRTQYMYAAKYGIDDTDAAGNVIAGSLAGQSIYGGASANTNLTLFANAGDSGGGNTGFIQMGDSVRPLVDSAFSLGTNALRWSGVFTDALDVGTMSIASGSITDSSGAIDFGDENLTTTGTITAANIGGSTGVFGTLTVAGGSITDTTGAISFADENLSTTGTLASGVHTVAGTLVLASGSITDTGGAISFGDENLSTTGTLAAGNATFTRADVDNLRLDGNTLSSTDVNGNIILSANGTGAVDVQSPMTTLGQTVTGTVSITGQLNIDNLRLDANVISATNANGSITLSPNGSGNIVAGATILPATTAVQDLGGAGAIWRDLYIGGSLKDGTNTFTIAELMSLRDVAFRDLARTQPAQAGDAIFYDAVNGVWLASAPDSEIDHGTVSGLLDDDHTQYALLAGRAGGQSLVGGSAAGESLTLESTSNGTKGSVFFSSNLAPTTNASFAAGWAGTDIGDATHYVRDVYTKGVFKGFRLENYTSVTLPGASAQNTGRVVFSTDDQVAYVDVGGSWIKIGGSNKYLNDTVWTGAQTTQTFTVSADIDDARNAIWAIHDNANNFERIYAKIEAISQTQVRVTVAPALPAGSYRLIGIE